MRHVFLGGSYKSTSKGIDRAFQFLLINSTLLSLVAAYCPTAVQSLGLAQGNVQTAQNNAREMMFQRFPAAGENRGGALIPPPPTMILSTETSIPAGIGDPAATHANPYMNRSACRSRTINNKLPRGRYRSSMRDTS